MVRFTYGSAKPATTEGVNTHPLDRWCDEADDPTDKHVLCHEAMSLEHTLETRHEGNSKVLRNQADTILLRHGGDAWLLA